MALVRSEAMIAILFGLALLFCRAQAAGRGLVDKLTVFDVTKFGAKADPKYDSHTAFIKAWDKACHSPSPAKVVVPPGNYMASEVLFVGPCTGHVSVEVHGSIAASTDISEYPNGSWFSVEHVDGFTLDGANFEGSFNGTGDNFWKNVICKARGNCDCPPLPPNFYFIDVKNADVGFLSSINSKGFHFKIEGSSNVHLHDLKIDAPATSPHTNAASVVSSDNVQITQSNINTGGGNDCVIWGADTTNYVYSQVSCNGH